MAARELRHRLTGMKGVVADRADIVGVGGRCRVTCVESHVW